MGATGFASFAWYRWRHGNDQMVKVCTLEDGPQKAVTVIIRLGAYVMMHRDCPDKITVITLVGSSLWYRGNRGVRMCEAME